MSLCLVTAATGRAVTPATTAYTVRSCPACVSLTRRSAASSVNAPTGSISAVRKAKRATARAAKARVGVRVTVGVRLTAGGRRGRWRCGRFSRRPGPRRRCDRRRHLADVGPWDEAAELPGGGGHDDAVLRDKEDRRRDPDVAESRGEVAVHGELDCSTPPADGRSGPRTPWQRPVRRAVPPARRRRCSARAGGGRGRPTPRAPRAPARLARRCASARRPGEADGEVEPGHVLGVAKGRARGRGGAERQPHDGEPFEARLDGGRPPSARTSRVRGSACRGRSPTPGSHGPRGCDRPSTRRRADGSSARRRRRHRGRVRAADGPLDEYTVSMPWGHEGGLGRAGHRLENHVAKVGLDTSVTVKSVKPQPDRPGGGARVDR